MRRLLSSSLVFFAGVVSVPVAVAPASPGTGTADYREDPRAETLRHFFDKGDCPAGDYAEDFLDAADRYDLDWRLLPSLSFVESTGGRFARNNNLFGWASGHAQFPTPEAAIYEVGYRLAHSSLYKDKDLDSLLGTYNPSADYVRMVKSVMRRIAPD